LAEAVQSPSRFALQANNVMSRLDCILNTLRSRSGGYDVDIAGGKHVYICYWTLNSRCRGRGLHAVGGADADRKPGIVAAAAIGSLAAPPAVVYAAPPAYYPPAPPPVYYGY
jgi:hypothetical protein